MSYLVQIKTHEQKNFCDHLYSGEEQEKSNSGISQYPTGLVTIGGHYKLQSGQGFKGCLSLMKFTFNFDNRRQV